MGTLKNQKPRNYNNVTKSDIIFYCEEIKYISKQSGFTINQIIEIIKIKELERKNNLYVNNGDIFDEQMSGLAEILNTFKDGN